MGGEGRGGGEGRRGGEGREEYSHSVPSSEVVFQICGIAELGINDDLGDPAMCLRMAHEHSQD